MHSGKKHCNRKKWRALEVLREQTRPVDLRSAETVIQITATEAARLIERGHSWELRGGIVRSVKITMPKWAIDKLNWRQCEAGVLGPSAEYAR